jgi:DNA polymerase III subunit gamma/tau
LTKALASANLTSSTPGVSAAAEVPLQYQPTERECVQLPMQNFHPFGRWVLAKEGETPPASAPPADLAPGAAAPAAPGGNATLPVGAAVPPPPAAPAAPAAASSEVPAGGAQSPGSPGETPSTSSAPSDADRSSVPPAIIYAAELIAGERQIESTATAADGAAESSQVSESEQQPAEDQTVRDGSGELPHAALESISGIASVDKEEQQQEEQREEQQEQQQEEEGEADDKLQEQEQQVQQQVEEQNHQQQDSQATVTEPESSSPAEESAGPAAGLEATAAAQPVAGTLPPPSHPSMSLAAALRAAREPLFIPATVMSSTDSVDSGGLTTVRSALDATDSAAPAAATKLPESPLPGAEREAQSAADDVLITVTPAVLETESSSSSSSSSSSDSSRMRLGAVPLPRRSRQQRHTRIVRAAGTRAALIPSASPPRWAAVGVARTH